MISFIREREELRLKLYFFVLMWLVGEMKWGYNIMEDESKIDIVISVYSIFL